jgi:hypothetical protein
MILQVAWLCLRIALAIVIGYFLYDQTVSPALVIALTLLYARSEMVHFWQEWIDLKDEMRVEHMATIRKKWQKDMEKHTKGPKSGCTV